MIGSPVLPDVDAVVVNRDGGDALFRALDSLAAQTGVAVSAVVVDNGSARAERERIAAEQPATRVIAFSGNLGFAGAANEGIARTRAPFVLLVNNDAVLEPDYAAALAARLAMDDRLAAVQGLVLTEDGDRVDSAGLEWNARGEAVPVLAGALPASVPTAPFEVSGVSATAAMYRREALEAMAPQGAAFETAYFAYYEDVDLALRLSREGWRFLCEPAAIARHEGSRTGRRTPFRRAFWTSRNRWRTLFRNFSPSLLMSDLLSLLHADLAHARAVGWTGLALPLLVWPRLPLLAMRFREEPGRFASWPRAAAPPRPQGPKSGASPPGAPNEAPSPGAPNRV
ncbi:MAG TPA: glycosyltransferase family 2 protein [Thermoanaerobaculia bacterium]|nr:glycosyltransferase family 2 protein [Thermoanaerobaculia bacterium]